MRITNTDLARHFNPLPRKEGDCSKGKKCSANIYFNPLPRKEGDQACQQSVDRRCKNFNPLPRKEGDCKFR